MLQNKYIIRLSFIGLFLNIIANIILYRYFMIEEIIIRQTEAQNSQITEIYKKQILKNHISALAKLNASAGYKPLLTDPEFINFMKASIDFFESNNSLISLYDMHGDEFISNGKIEVIKKQDNGLYSEILTKLDRYFLKNFRVEQNISPAFKGKAIHILLPSASSLNSMGQSSGTFISSYIPLIDDQYNNFKLNGVLKISVNVSQQWDNIAYLEKRVFISFLIIFTVFFIIVVYNTSYAQGIINQQFQTNRILEEAKLRAENDSIAKTEFLANVSHELRTPLNAVIGFSELILAESYGKLENVQYKDYIQDINNSGKHLLSVINDILDFSKASADKLKVDSVELDLNKLASSSMRFVKPRADEAGVLLIENLPEEHIVILADPKRLKQALLNLLSNSVKFTPEKGSVTLAVVKDPIQNLVYVKVTDTGIGMSQKDIPKALSTFGQIDNKLSRKYEGTGLGLPLTKKLVELMLGKFDIQSTVGIGTTVTLTFKYI